MDTQAETSKWKEEMKTLQRHVGGLVKTILDLKAKVEKLEEKAKKDKNDEVEKIMEKQIVIDKAIVDNSAAITKIDKELQKALKQKVQAVQKDKFEDQVDSAEVDNAAAHEKKCRYFNCGFCKYKRKCRYTHPKNICKDHIRNLKCETKECPDRHLKVCKWQADQHGCTWKDCDYLHNTLGSSREAQLQEYKCISCKCAWKEQTCVVKHMIENIETYFCLNCDDWVQHKQNIYNPGWTLMNEAGNLRMDI